MKCILPLIAALGLTAGAALADNAGDVSSLRAAPPDDSVPVNEVFHQREGRMPRNYRQQPPLVPHQIDNYQIDRNANQCLACHDWSNAGARNAPTLSMTHYLDRDGNQLDQVAGTRWFCTQCHVPQVDAPALVDNTFTPSASQ